MNTLLRFLALALILMAPLARAQFATPPTWESLTETERTFINLTITSDTTEWTYAKAVSNAGFERAAQFACGMFLRNKGYDRANALLILQANDAQFAHDKADGTKGMSEFGGIGFVAARAFFGNLFDAATNASVDHALQYVSDWAYRPGTDNGRNPDWLNFAAMNAVVLEYSGAVYGNATWTSAGTARWDGIYAAVKRNSCDPEYNSSTYVGIALSALGIAAKASQSADVRAKAAEMTDLLWSNVAKHYNASMRNTSGPYYRSYGDGMDLMGIKIATYTQDIAHGPVTKPVGGGGTVCLDAVCGQTSPGNVPAASAPALFNFQGNRRFTATFQHTNTTYTSDVAIEEDRMAAVINSYTNPYAYPNIWDPFGYPADQLVMTMLHWKSGIADDDKPLATLKIYNSSFYRTRFNAAGDIEVLLDKVGAAYPLRFKAISTAATPAVVSGTRWDLPGQSFEVTTTLPSPTVTVTGAETTILYDTTGAATNAVVFTLKFVKSPTHNWLGGQFKTATLLEASSAGAANSAGLFITGMAAGSAGYTAGLREKDIITAANGQAVKYPEDLFRAIRAAGSGAVSLTVRRSGANQTVNLGSAVPQATALTASLAPAYTWRNSRGGAWSTAANWRGGAVPVTTASDTVGFSDADLIFDATLTLDATPTVGGLQFGDVLPTNNWLVSGSGAFVLASAADVPVIEVLNQTTNLAVPLQGGLGFKKQGAGRLVLSATTSTYSGTTTVAAGTLQFASPAAFYNNTPASWTAANLVVESGGTAAFNVGGPGEFTASNIDFLTTLGTDTGGFKSGSAIGLDTTNDADGTFTYSSPITAPNGGANSMGFAKLGAGTLILSAANSYTGNTTVAGGTLVAATTGKLGSGNLTVASGATCELRNTAGALADTASVFLSATGKLNLASGVSQTVQSLFIDGVWQASGTWNASRDPAHFSGTGSLTVTSGPMNVPAGLTFIPGNAQVSLSWTAIPGASYTVKRATVSGGPYTILGTTASASFTDPSAINGQTYYYIVTSTVGGVESFPSAETSATPSPNVWTGTSSTAWETPGNWSTALPGSSDVAVFAGPLTANQPSVSGNNSVGGMLIESPGWTIGSASTGTLTVGANGVVVNANSGTVTLNKAVTILNGTTRVWKGKTGSLLVIASLATPAGTTSLQWGDANDPRYQGTLKLTFSGNGPNIPFVVSGGTLQANKTGWINSRDLTVSGGTFLVTSSNGDLIRNGVTLNSGLVNWGGFNEVLPSLALNGGTLRGSNSTLSIDDTSPAKITVTDDVILGDASDVSKLKLARSGATGILDLNGGTHTLTVDSAVELALPVTNGNFIKQGAGALILSSNATLSGETAVSGGTLEVDGRLDLSATLEAQGAVTVNSGAVLSGNGTINGPVTVNGILAPGAGGKGTLRIANSLTFGPGSTTTVSINRTATPNCTGVTGATSVVYNGQLVVNAIGTPALGDRYVLFSSVAYSGAFASLNLPALASGLTWDVTGLAVDGSITVKGNLVLDSSLKLHLDASNTASLIVDANNRVSRWNDADGGANYAAQASAAQQPAFAVDSTFGHSVVDFGSFVTGTTGRWMQFKDGTGTDLNIATIRSVIAVMKGGNHILGDDNAYHFHRGGDIAAATNTLWSNSYASASIKSGQTYLNGGAAPINGTTTSMPAGYWLASVITTGAVEASRLACDRSLRTGGQQIAELLIYDRVLTDTERQAAEAVLKEKWSLGVSNPFASWIYPFGFALGQDTKSADPDGDGLNNIAEFALDGNPVSGAANSRVVSKIANVGGQPGLVLTLPVRNGAVFTVPGAPADSSMVSSSVDGVIYKIQGSTDLASWPLAIAEVTGADKSAIESGLPATDAGWTYRTFCISDPIDAATTRQFIRAAIVYQP